MEHLTDPINTTLFLFVPFLLPIVVPVLHRFTSADSPLVFPSLSCKVVLKKSVVLMGSVKCSMNPLSKVVSKNIRISGFFLLQNKIFSPSTLVILFIFFNLSFNFECGIFA
jgi:hypothetical protein